MAIINVKKIRIELLENPQDGDTIFFRDPVMLETFNIKFKENVSSGTIDSSGSKLIDIKNTLAATKSTLINLGLNQNRDAYRVVDVDSTTIDVIALDTDSTWQKSSTVSRLRLTRLDDSVEEKIRILSIDPVDSGTCSDIVGLRVRTSSNIESYAVETGSNPIHDQISTDDFVVSVPRNLPLNLRITSNQGYFGEEIENPIAPIRNFEITPNVEYLNARTVVTVDYTFNESVNSFGTNFNSIVFSTDNVTYQSSNKYQDVADGNITFYASDKFGCVKSVDVVINSTTSFKTNGEISFSLSNSFHWASREEINYCDNYPRLDNTLSFEERTLNNHGFVHLVQKCDTVTNQFRSELSVHKAYLNNCDSRTEITIFKKTDNRNKISVLEAYMLRANDAALTVVFFENKTIPSYINVGDNLTFPDGVFKITSFFTDTRNETDYVVTDRPFNQSGNIIEPVELSYSYSVDSSEVYEIPLDMQRLEGKYWLELEALYGTISKKWQSEIFEVRERHEKTYEVIANHTNNTDINYSTGIKHLLRLPYERTKIYIGEDEIKTLDTDTSIVHREANVKDAWEFEFTDMPTHMMPKLRRIFSLNQLYIDREGYVKLGSIESEIIGVTNLYKVKARFYSSGSYFSTNSEKIPVDNNQSGFLEVNSSGIGFINDGIGGSPIGIND